MAQTQKLKALTLPELSAFFSSFSMLLKAGVPVNECPAIVAGDMDEVNLGHVGNALDTLLNGGEIFLLSEALQRTKAFPQYAVDMVRLGEESGRLESVAESLGHYYQQQSALNQSIRSAITGPVLLLVMMCIVLFFLIVFVLPVYDRVFLSLGRVSSGGMDFTYVAARLALIVAGAFLLLLLLGLLLYLTGAGRRVLFKFAQTIPALRRIHYAMSASQLTHGLAMLLASGISSSDALRKASALVNSKQMLKKIPTCIAEVDDGKDLGRALVDNNVLAGFEAKVLVSASRAGQTEVAMKNLSDNYAAQANAGIEQAVSVIEPALVGILSVAIGIILLSVMLPLTNIMSSIG